MTMINLEELQLISEEFIKARASFEKGDFMYILNRTTFATRFNDFLTSNYYKRRQLIEKGFVGVCYTYKVIYSDGKNKNHRTFALFSYNQNIMVDDSYYKRVIANIENLKKEKSLPFKLKKFMNYYSLVDSKPTQYKLDYSLTEGKDIFLHYIELVPQLNPGLKLGLNYVLYAPLVSKEIIYLPEKYIKTKEKEVTA